MRDFERAGVLEYWIVDPDERRVTVLALNGTVYRLHGEFSSGQVASGVLIPGLMIAVDDILRLGHNSENWNLGNLHPGNSNPGSGL
jgi:Uma2 family endonuclease